jgi:hypothetical protein
MAKKTDQSKGLEGYTDTNAEHRSEFLIGTRVGVLVREETGRSEPDAKGRVRIRFKTVDKLGTIVAFKRSPSGSVEYLVAFDDGTEQAGTSPKRIGLV